MSTQESQDATSLMFAFLPVLPSLFFGLVLVWQQGATSTSLSFAFLMVLFSIVSSFFIWSWHIEHIEKVRLHHQKKYKEGLNSLTLYAAELERLLLTAEAKLAEQVKTAKDASELETAQLLKNLDNYKGKLIFVNEPDPSPEEDKPVKPLSLDEINKRFDQLRNELDIILQPLQLQSKGSQILALVLANLTTIRETVQQIEKQEAQRNKKTLNVDALMSSFQTQFESLKKAR